MPVPSEVPTSGAEPTAPALAGAPEGLAGQRTGEVGEVLAVYDKLAAECGVSVADLIVLGGNLAIEQAAQAAGVTVSVPFAPGRGMPLRLRPMRASFEVQEPLADGFRNWLKQDYVVTAEELLLDRAQLMGLTACEMTALVGGPKFCAISYQ